MSQLKKVHLLLLQKQPYERRDERYILTIELLALCKVCVASFLKNKLNYALILLCLNTACSKHNTIKTLEMNETAVISGTFKRQNKFTGQSYKENFQFNLNVEKVIEAKNADSDPNASIILVLVEIENKNNVPLSLSDDAILLKTLSGKTYKSATIYGPNFWPKFIAQGHIWDDFGLQSLGPDTKREMLMAYRVPFDGLGEDAYLTLESIFKIRIGQPTYSHWVLYDSVQAVKSIERSMN